MVQSAHIHQEFPTSKGTGHGGQVFVKIQNWSIARVTFRR